VQLHNARDNFSDAGFSVVLVGLGTPGQAEQFRDDFSLSFPIICDPQKELYRMFDLGRSSIVNTASPGVLLKGLRAMSQGYMPGIPRGDTMQLPGVFLIDAEGNIRYSYFSKDPSDHPSIETLLNLQEMFK
jgi:peroxiredoxin